MQARTSESVLRALSFTPVNPCCLHICAHTTRAICLSSSSTVAGGSLRSDMAARLHAYDPLLVDCRGDKSFFLTG